MEAIFRHEARAALPAAICSTALFAINAGLLRYVFRFDRSAQRAKSE
jgi:hypothetical protein